MPEVLKSASVYLGSTVGAVKIGTSAHSMTSRAQQFGVDLRMIAELGYATEAEAFDAATELHSRFAPYLLAGREWFEPRAEIFEAFGADVRESVVRPEDLICLRQPIADGGFVPFVLDRLAHTAAMSCLQTGDRFSLEGIDLPPTPFDRLAIECASIWGISAQDLTIPPEEMADAQREAARGLLIESQGDKQFRVTAFDSDGRSFGSDPWITVVQAESGIDVRLPALPASDVGSALNAEEAIAVLRRWHALVAVGYLHLINARNIRVVERTLPRSLRRRISRSRRTEQPIPAGVYFIDIFSARRAESVGHPGHGGKHRYQYLVAGHRRRKPHSVESIWIGSYLRGPAGAPFLGGQAVRLGRGSKLPQVERELGRVEL